MRAPINVSLIKHPMNWIVVLLMVLIAGCFGHLALSLFQVEPKEESSYSEVSSGQVAQS